MLDEMAKNPGIVQPDVDLRLNKPEMRIEVDRATRRRPGRERRRGGAHRRDHAGRPQRHALQARRRAVRRDRADRRPAAAPRRRTSTASTCAAAATPMVPLSALVKVRESVSPRELNHFGQRRSVSITANLAPGLFARRGAAVHGRDGRPRCCKPGYTTDLNGTSREFRNSQGALGHRVRAGAGVHLPGAGGAVRELRRSAS